MKKSIFTLAALMLLAISCTGKKSSPEQMALQPEQEQDSSELTVLIAGDLMQHEPQINAARRGNTYDYSECFQFVKPEIERADIAIANFEVTTGGAPYTGYPCFSAPDEYLRASIDAGFDVLTTANNHCCDRRAKGLRRTIEMMDSMKVRHLGTYRSQAERDQNYPFVIEKNGIKVCLLNFTYGTNGIPVPTGYVVNMIDTAQIAADIVKAKAMNPDVIIAIPHWGIEYQLLPEQKQKDLAAWLFAKGVDHIVGGHPHVLQPMEVSEWGGGKHLLVYSLGNYISNQSKPNTTGGAMVKMVFMKKDGKTVLKDAAYTLEFVSRPQVSGNKNYRIYPVGYSTEKMNAAEKEVRQTFLNTARKLFGEHNKGISEYTY